MLASARATGAAAIETLTVPGPDGAALIEFTVLPGDDQVPAHAFGRDQTFAWRMREALVESRERFKELVEIASDFVWETGADGTFAFVSPRGALGYTAKELIGRTPAAYEVEQPNQAAASPFSTRRTVENVEAGSATPTTGRVVSMPPHSPCSMVPAPG